MPTEWPSALVIEILATTANLIFVIFMIRENIICWFFGIVGSLLSIYLFIGAKLYSEAFLYFFYVLFGIWGWIRWHRRQEQDSNPVSKWSVASHIRALLGASALALGLGYIALSLTDAQRPFIDAFTTAFSFLATYLEVAKVLDAWIYWILINLASIWLYHDRSLDIYAVLIGVYALLSVWGYISWNRAYRESIA
jgi:nicotinamide mononucleotide transporter